MILTEIFPSVQKHDIFSTGKRPLRIPRLRQKDNIRIYPKEIDVNRRNYVDRDFWRVLVNAASDLRVP